MIHLKRMHFGASCILSPIYVAAWFERSIEKAMADLTVMC